MNDRDDQSPGNRAQNSARSAEQRGAADDHGGNGIEQQRLARLCRPGTEPRRIDEPGKARAHARQDIQLQDMPADINARPPRGGFTGPDGVVVLPKPGLRQQVVHHQYKDGGDDHDMGDVENLAVANGRKHLVLDRHSRATCQQERHPPRHAEHAQRPDERRHAQARDQQAVHQPRNTRHQH